MRSTSGFVIVLTVLISIFISIAEPSAQASDECNRPVSDMPPGQDGCSYFVPIERPATPIAPPCILDWKVQDEVGGDETAGLLVTISHPELQPSAPRGWVQFARSNDGGWTATVDATVSCAKDEAPLAWALLEILNGGEVDRALDIYQSPLPDDLMVEVLRLAYWRDVFMPIILN